MPGLSVARTETLEFKALYNKYTKQFGCPIQALFHIGFKSRKIGYRLDALKTLVSYQFPKQAILKAEIEQAGQLLMSWDETLDLPPGSAIDIYGEPVLAIEGDTPLTTNE